MISKEVLRDASYLADAEIDEFTIGMFAASFRLALRDMDMYCFEKIWPLIRVEPSPAHIKEHVYDYSLSNFTETIKKYPIFSLTYNSFYIVT